MVYSKFSTLYCKGKQLWLFSDGEVRFEEIVISVRTTCLLPGVRVAYPQSTCQRSNADSRMTLSFQIWRPLAGQDNRGNRNNSTIVPESELAESTKTGNRVSISVAAFAVISANGRLFACNPSYRCSLLFTSRSPRFNYPPLLLYPWSSTIYLILHIFRCI